MDPRIDSVRSLLRDWAHWSKLWFPRHLWYKSSVPYLDNMLPQPSESPESNPSIEHWQLLAIDDSISLLPKPLSLSIRWHYLNEPPPPNAHKLLPFAESALIPKLTKRNILL